MGYSSISPTADRLSSPHDGLLVIWFARFPDIPSSANSPDYTTIMSTTHAAARYDMANVAPLEMASRFVVCIGLMPLSKLSITPKRT